MRRRSSSSRTSTGSETFAALARPPKRRRFDRRHGWDTPEPEPGTDPDSIARAGFGQLVAEELLERMAQRDSVRSLQAETCRHFWSHVARRADFLLRRLFQACGVSLLELDGRLFLLMGEAHVRRDDPTSHTMRGEIVSFINGLCHGDTNTCTASDKKVGLFLETPAFEKYSPQEKPDASKSVGAIPALAEWAFKNRTCAGGRFVVVPIEIRNLPDIIDRMRTDSQRCALLPPPFVQHVPSLPLVREYQELVGRVRAGVHEVLPKYRATLHKVAEETAGALCRGLDAGSEFALAYAVSMRRATSLDLMYTWFLLWVGNRILDAWTVTRMLAASNRTLGVLLFYGGANHSIGISNILMSLGARQIFKSPNFPAFRMDNVFLSVTNFLSNRNMSLSCPLPGDSDNPLSLSSIVFPGSAGPTNTTVKRSVSPRRYESAEDSDDDLYG